MAVPVGRDRLPRSGSRDGLPGSWSYGVCRDGRVFFIDDDTRTTTWLHPRSGEPVNSGHMICSDLPQGWEEGFTEEGASFYIDHNQRTTTFQHPVTGRVSAENLDLVLQQRLGVGTMMLGPSREQLSSATISDASTTITSSTVDSAPRAPRSAGKLHSFGKREQAIQRNPNVPVVLRGWLYKRDRSGMRLWKRKWFVLADFCLFYYKDSREEAVLGSIPMPSYVVSLVEPDDHISRKFTFKARHGAALRSHTDQQGSVVDLQAEHGGMRTYFFSADTQEDLNTWLRAMKQATMMHNQSDTLSRPSDQPQKHLVCHSQTDHTTVQQTKTLESQSTNAMVHEVLLEPIPVAEHRFYTDSAATSGLKQLTSAFDMDGQTSLTSDPTADGLLSASAPVSRVSSRAPSRAASILPPSVCSKNIMVATPSPILEPNGIAAGTYQRSPTPPPLDPQPQVRRRSALEDVEQWVQMQRAEHKVSGENTLPRRTPPVRHRVTTPVDAYRTLPRTPRHSPPPARLGEYKYAQDRLSHFRLSPDPGGQENTVWQLYEWQQRHQFRHGSPTAPLYTPAPDYPFGPRPPSTVPPTSVAPRSEGHPRCVSVPPTPVDVPPTTSSRTLSPSRRPHTPAERVTVRPAGSSSVVDMPFVAPLNRTKSQLLKAATMERRSLPRTGYMTHTVSAPSLHGKTPEDLTLFLIQLRRHRAKMAATRQQTLAHLQRLGSAPSPVSRLQPPPPPPGSLDSQADHTYLQLKKDLDYLDLKVAGGDPRQKEVGKPLKVAESDVDVKLSQLCEQDKILKELEVKISSLKEDKDKLESVLDLSRQQMEQYKEQPGHAHKIAHQQRLLQEDLVSIRAQISRRSKEMALAWEEYGYQERSVEQLRVALQGRMSHSATPQDRKEVQRELWRIQDVLAGLSGRRENYRLTVDWLHNPERMLVLSGPAPMVPTDPTLSREVPSPPQWMEDPAPPRPPLPRLYDYEETPPVVPPLPREASVGRHTSVRGLKRQSERKRDREPDRLLNGDWKAELRSYLSEPELTGSRRGHQYLQNTGLDQSGPVPSFVTLRKGPAPQQARPQSALDPDDMVDPPGARPRSRMTAEEQLQRMKRHQRALVRERQKTLRSSSAEPPTADEQQRDGDQVDQRDPDLEPLDYDLDISRELSKPLKVPILERYVEAELQGPLSLEEQQERSSRVQRIRKLLTRSSFHSYQPSTLLDLNSLDSVLQQQEKIMDMSYVLASEASQKSRLVAARNAALD
ncbi:pleckstrin homology domain-containing family A member 7-like isoform X3 [Nelusetta ayraudi]|uniref:pleckstrin homology domain-containing family A member 7-like isoform X3 n=1 Tax=Nelusetta ayraudi TaxID=303726 RepID=UPI003F72CB67